MYQGDRKQIQILVTNPDTGLALDLAPFTSITWVAYRGTNKETILSKSLSDGISVPTPADGTIVIDLLPADTEDIYPSIFLHECEIDDGNDDVATVCTGTLKILFSKA